MAQYWRGSHEHRSDAPNNPPYRRDVSLRRRVGQAFSVPDFRLLRILPRGGSLSFVTSFLYSTHQESLSKSLVI